MNRALLAGLSGTIAFQNRLDVVATNLANATTVGYKEGRVTFLDALYQTLRGGRAGWDVDVGAGTSYKVQGWMGVDGQVNATGSASDLVFQLSDLWPPQPTGNATVVGNLDATSAAAAEVQSTISVYDSLSEMHQITVTFTKTGTNEWECEASFGADTATTTLTFDADGKLTGTESVALDMTLTNGATSPLSVAIALGQVTQLAQSSSVAISSQDGRRRLWSPCTSATMAWLRASSPTAAARPWHSWLWPTSRTPAACAA